MKIHDLRILSPYLENEKLTEKLKVLYFEIINRI
jgi:hypothetical protein